jgi:hypothetical protein
MAAGVFGCSDELRLGLGLTPLMQKTTELNVKVSGQAEKTRQTDPTKKTTNKQNVTKQLLNG